MTTTTDYLKLTDRTIRALQRAGFDPPTNDEPWRRDGRFVEIHLAGSHIGLLSGVEVDTYDRMTKLRPGQGFRNHLRLLGFLR